MKLNNIKVIIGLGNPGPKFYYTRHNIGFRVLDAIAEKFNTQWRTKENLELATVQINNQNIILIKPLTFMNSSGNIWPYLSKQGVKPEEILIVHDELELPFGKLAFKLGGSAKGHNGLKSFINIIGQNFMRLRFGIARPENREDVPDYVLEKFKESENILNNFMQEAANLIINNI